MTVDFTIFFKQYEEILAMTDEVFERVKIKYPKEVKCRIKCSDCCHALFDISLVEALFINHHFNKIFSGKIKEQLVAKANAADRKIYKIKKKAYQDMESGANETKILMSMATKRVRCPLLNAQDQCDLYEFRPATCRVYGIPTSIGGLGHTCGLSGFVEGNQYPTVNLDIIHQKLYKISDAIIKKIKSRYVKMADMLVPLSMALLTDYNEEYLGVSR